MRCGRRGAIAEVGEVVPGWNPMVRAALTARAERIRGNRAAAAVYRNRVQAEGDRRRMGLSPALMRRVYGANVHTTLEVARRHGTPPIFPWTSERGGRDFHAREPIMAATSDGSPMGPGLAGFVDDAIATVRQRIAQARAQIEAMIGQFLVSKRTLRASRDVVAAGLRRVLSNPSGFPPGAFNELKQLEAEGERLAGSEKDLSVRVKEATDRFDAATRAEGQLGLAVTATIAIVAAAIALITLVAGKVVTHTNEVNRYAETVAMVETGAITAAEAERILKAGAGSGGGMFEGVGREVGTALVLGIGAYFAFQAFRK